MSKVRREIVVVTRATDARVLTWSLLGDKSGDTHKLHAWPTSGSEGGDGSLEIDASAATYDSDDDRTTVTFDLDEGDTATEGTYRFHARGSGGSDDYASLGYTLVISATRASSEGVLEKQTEAESVVVSVPMVVEASGSGSGTVTSVDVSGGTTGLTASGGPITGTGTITLAGTLAVANGGTGATSAGAALTALGAEPAITTLPISKGGTGASSAGAARTALSVYSIAGTDTAITDAIDALVSGAPAALDTLNEIAAALGDDATFEATVTAALANRLRVDAAQSLTTGQQSQGRTNLALGTLATKDDADLASDVTGTLGVARGGTGSTSLPSPSNYTPTGATLLGHLEGMDTAIGTAAGGGATTLGGLSDADTSGGAEGHLLVRNGSGVYDSRLLVAGDVPEIPQSKVTDLGTDLAAKLDASQVGTAGGAASLDGGGKVPTTQLPALAITETHVVADQTARDALSVQEGDVAIVQSESKSYIWDGTEWEELLSPTGGVTSFAGRTGAVQPAADDYAIADITGLQSALDGKSDTGHTHAASAITSGTFDAARLPTMVGADAANPGTKGAVPAPSAGDQDKFLAGGASWGYAPVRADPTSDSDNLIEPADGESRGLAISHTIPGSPSGSITSLEVIGGESGSEATRLAVQYSPGGDGWQLIGSGLDSAVLTDVTADEVTADSVLIATAGTASSLVFGAATAGGVGAYFADAGQTIIFARAGTDLLSIGDSGIGIGDYAALASSTAGGTNTLTLSVADELDLGGAALVNASIDAGLIDSGLGSPSNYTPAAATLAGHLSGIDDALAGGGGASALDDLSDVTIGTPAAGNPLGYDGSVWSELAAITLDGGSSGSPAIDLGGYAGLWSESPGGVDTLHLAADVAVVAGVDIAVPNTDALRIGQGSSASGSNATAIGQGATASLQGVAVGQNATAGSYATAIGRGASASALGVVAIGVAASAAEGNCTVVGDSGSADHNSCTILGSFPFSRAKGDFCIGAGKADQANPNQAFRLQSRGDKSSNGWTNPDDIFAIEAEWYDTTYASRKSEWSLKATDATARRTVARGYSDGSRGYLALSAHATAPADADLNNGELAFYDDGSGSLAIKLKDSGGTVRTGTVSLT